MSSGSQAPSWQDQRPHPEPLSPTQDVKDERLGGLGIRIIIALRRTRQEKGALTAFFASPYCTSKPYCEVKQTPWAERP